MRSKPFFLILIAVFTAGVLVPAQGDPLQKSLVIIDTGFDTSLPIIKDAVIYESCIMFWSGCPNGTSFQEGPGASALPTNISNTSNMSHGTQMASIAMNANPGQKIVLIRVVAYNANGDRMPISDSTVVKVFKWIATKRTELNIGAVAMAQGYHPTASGKNYCPKNVEMERIILDLKIANVPVFLPTGNAADKTRIDWPACIPAAIAIGAINSKGQIADYSNYDRNLVDFYTPGDAQALLPGGSPSSAVGTSVSTLIAASYWMNVASLKPELTVPEVSQLFRNAGRMIFDSKFRYGREMQIKSFQRG
ncbi:MAG: S8/S53 family peptidase [Candidatus Planktophila sp.]|nr:S8/S53 family peptidase [Candidatus Planktophila sp.]